MGAILPWNRAGGCERLLALLARLCEEIPRFRDVPVLMPVSIFARVAFEGVWRARPLDHVLPILEDAIDEDATRHALERFLAATRPSPGRAPALTPAAGRG